MEAKKKTGDYAALHAALDIVVDCGKSNRSFKRGELLEDVMKGTLESMIRMGQAVTKDEVPPPEPPPETPPEGGK